MNALISWLGGEVCRNLTVALAHTLWQGLIVAGLLYAYLRAVPAEAARRRYAAGVISLSVVVLAALVTWSIFNYSPAPAEQTAGQASGQGASTEATTETVFVVTPSGVVPAEQALSTTGESKAQEATTNWYAWTTGLWLAGAAVMLSRAVAIVVAGGRLRRRCVPVQNDAVVALVEQVRRSMRIGRQIQVLAGEHIFVPGVVGCLWPALLLPAVMATGTPADDLKAILAHELAHIRRFDYLVNFAQMVIEALLFFNPAIWWISRQMRTEREACCDTASIALTGHKAQYAQTLVTWAEKLRDQRVATAALIGFAGSEGESTLLDRVRRIVVAGHRPRLRVSWPTALGMLLLSGLALTALWQGTDAAVTFAGNILTPQQRVEAMAEIAEQYGFDDREYGQADKVLVAGAVRTWDGKPMPAGARLTARSDRPRYGASADVRLTREDQPEGVAAFGNRVEFGRIWLFAQAEGYAPAFAGPFDPEPAGTIEGIEMELQEGFASSIRILDEDGLPIEGAELAGGYVFPESTTYRYTIKLTTDGNGVATLEHALAGAAALRIEADGFEPRTVEDIRFQKGQSRDVILRTVAPIAGVVLSPTGEPISGATVHMLASRTGEIVQEETDINAEPDFVTGPDGTFALARLNGAREYQILIQADGYNRRYLADVRPGAVDLTVTLDVRPVIRGVITGELDRLAVDRNGTPCVRCTDSRRYGNWHWTGVWKNVPVRIEDGIGTFEITNFYGQEVEITAGGKKVTLDIETADLNNVVIDLPPESTVKREVILAFSVPDDSPAVEGGVHVGYRGEDGTGYHNDWLDIVDGQAHCEVPVPCSFGYNIDFNRGKRPVGYWFKKASSIEILPGDEPYVVVIPTYPAGSIYGRVLQPDGTLAANASVALMVTTLPEAAGAGLDQFDLPDAIRGSGSDRGRFNAAPLPFGGEYLLIAHVVNNFQVVGPLALDQAHPIIARDIQLTDGVTLTGRILDADGTPATDKLRLGVTVRQNKRTYNFLMGEISPSYDGFFAFEDVNPNLRAQYFIDVQVRPGYLPVRYEIPDVTEPVVIQLERYQRLTGVVIDDTTGWPIMGAQVSARYEENGVRRLIEADGKTDQDGRFTFTNMTARRYELLIYGATMMVQQSTIDVTGGQPDPAILRIRIPHGSDLKPQPPR